MNDIVRICGYAVTYGQIALYDDDEAQCVEAGTFSAMLNRDFEPIDIRWGSHDEDAPVIARTSRTNYFEDEYGLGFWFDVDLRQNWQKLADMSRRVQPCDRCSVGMLVIDQSFEPYGSSRLRRIKRATLDHVAVGLTGSGLSRAAYMRTATWLTNQSLERAPLRIRALADRWEAGWGAAKARRAAQVSTASKPNPVSLLRGPRGEMSPADASRLRSVLASRQADYAHVRRNWAAAAMKNLGGSVSPVFAHAAFTRAGGFDGDFNRLLASDA
jgi:hypothetical protein